jgi:integrase
MAERMRGGVVRRGAGWSYVVRERDPQTGKTKPRWVSGFRTRTDAVNARADAVSAMGKGTYVAPQDLTVGDWLDRWMTGHELELKTSTAASYRAIIDRYLRPQLGHERVQALSPARLSVVFREMHEHGGAKGRPLSARTVEYTRAVLRRAMNDALLERVIAVNPVVGTKRPKAVKPKHSTWTADQVATFLGAPVEHPDGAERPATAAVTAMSIRARLGALFAVALATGMRRGEFLALRWDDVDLDEGVLAVERAVTVINGARTYDTPKNHERRTVKVDPDTVARLRALRREQIGARLAFGKAWQGKEGLVFTWEDGRPLDPDYASKAFTKAQVDLELPRLTFHEMRYTHATVLLRERMPVHIVSKRLGHKDPSVTLNVYADVIPQDDGEAADGWSRLVRRRQA